MMELSGSPNLINFILEEAMNGAYARPNEALSDAHNSEAKRLAFRIHIYIKYCYKEGNLSQHELSEMTQMLKEITRFASTLEPWLIDKYMLVLAAAQFGEPDLLRALLGKSPDVELSFDSRTPLIAAAGAAKSLNVEILLNAGANVNPDKLNSAWTRGPLEAAIVADDPKSVDILLKHGAPLVRQLDYHLFDAIEETKMKGSIQVYKSMLTFCADALSKKSPKLVEQRLPLKELATARLRP